MTVTVLALVFAKPGSEKDVLANLISQVEPTRRENGCINYDLHQSKDDPTKFMFYENWTTREALARHAESPHILESKKRNKDLIEKPTEITIWEQL